MVLVVLVRFCYSTGTSLQIVATFRKAFHLQFTYSTFFAVKGFCFCYVLCYSYSIYYPYKQS
jgi:hypothetical protein